MKTKSLILLISLLVFGIFGCGEDDADGGNDSTLHAQASLLQMEDAIGPYVQARLILISTADQEPLFVEDALPARVTFGGSSLDLVAQTVLLNSGERRKFYTLTSRENNLLTMDAGQTYAFEFTLPDGDTRPGQEQEAGDYTISIAVGDLSNTLSAASQPERATQLDVFSTNEFESGILAVTHTASQSLTWASYPFTEQLIDGPNDLLNAVDSLQEQAGKILTVPAEAFSRSGTHTVTYFGLTMSRSGGGIDGKLGEFTSIFAGVSASTNVDTP